MSPPWRTPYFRFALRFILIFTLLALPWPHWAEAWNIMLRTVAKRTLTQSQSEGPEEVGVASLQPPVHHADIRFTIANRALLNRDGSGPVRELDFKAAEIELRPMALLAALIFATPIPWRRRGWCLLGGTILLQAGILGVLWFSIWRESMELLLITESPGAKMIATATRNGLVQYSGLVFPIGLWLLLCVRRGETQRELARVSFSRPGGAAEPA